MERISCSVCNTEEFFEKYIIKRMPVAFTDENVSKSIGNPVKTLWSNSYLQSRSGTQYVRVEYKEDTPVSKFGEGVEKRMLFSEFLSEIEAGNENLYLTTQELEYDSDGRPSLTSPPVTQILSDILFTPSLFQTLIVANINLWFGATSRYVTSGLHHDYHDNLYVLLRGTKKITLYSPKDAEKLYTVGTISRVHPNGRINYINRPTRADGSDIHAEAALQASTRLDLLSKKMEERNGDDGDDSVDDTEEQIESALQDLLDAEAAAAVDEDGSESDDGGAEDDDDDDDDEGEGQISDSTAGLPVNARKRHHQSDVSDNATATSKIGRVDQSSNRPSNFSRVDTTLPSELLQQSFPLFQECQGVDITLTAGEMLYIPCGWFHEVRSLGPSVEGGHLALNYWFHPPDGDSFHRPYTSDFWRADMKARGLAP